MRVPRSGHYMGMSDFALAASESAAVDAPLPADEGELERVLEVEGRRLFAIAFSILRDPGEAEDAVQETAAAAWQGWATRNEPERTRAWLTTICVRKAMRRRGWLRRWTVGEAWRGQACSPTPTGAWRPTDAISISTGPMGGCPAGSGRWWRSTTGTATPWPRVPS